MKKIVLLAFVAFCFFGSVFSVFAKEKSIYNHGLDLVQELEKMSQSENYISCFFSSGKDFWSEKKDQFKLSKIVKCYQLDLNSENLIKMLSMMDSAEIDSVVMEMLTKKVSGSFYSSMLNSRIGTIPMALSSILTTSKIFDSSELKKSTNYVYVFDNSYSIFVSFVKGEDKAVLATANYILIDELINADIENLKKELNIAVFGAEIKEIK